MRCVCLLTAQFQGRVGGWSDGYPSGPHAPTYLAQVGRDDSQHAPLSSWLLRAAKANTNLHCFSIAVRKKRRCAQSVIPSNMIWPLWPAILGMCIYIYTCILTHVCVHMVARLVCALQGAACVSSETSDRGRAGDVRGSFHRLRLVHPEPIM